MASEVPIVDGKRVYKLVAQTQEEEDSYNTVEHRKNVKFVGLFGSIAHIVKGALAGGILSGHVAYMKAGWLVSICLNMFFGVYMAYCLHLLVQSAQILYKRTRIPTMSYPDVGECAMACFPNPKVSRFAKFARYLLDTVICIDLFGSCATYQLIIAKSIKQLVENTQEISLEGKPVCCIIMAVYYAFQYNPKFENMVTHKSLYNTFIFIGMNVFSMSCSGIVVAIETNMREPKKFPIAIGVGMSLVILCTFSASFFGYVGFLEKCEPPITVNYPMDLLPKVVKGLIALMIYISHALNFWVPFNLCYYYIRKRHKDNLFWEIFYRTIFVLLISSVALIFPNINALMGFIGSFCLTNMAFIWPNVITLLVIWKRPGLGKYKWRLWRSLIFIVIGLFVFGCGTLVNCMEMVKVFKTLFN
ncbi:hypothetical protein K1T71_013916 [Dendrolimus kikuchii]|uniref:Uncharacterized protein n=1 Tax=Dendrolimus kikuchii TaxID=765133 RepID=A0ACC1CGB4_9NEOP|nr:hypothetical protein K1T71_013916 [Dendrolimus kikuchii]